MKNLAKFSTTALLSLSLLLGMPAKPAKADAKDFLLGAGVGALANQLLNKNKSSGGGTQAQSPSSPRPAVQTGDADIQNALNALGYEAGSADGKFGPKTRAAIERFQASLNADQTGKLTAMQTTILMNKYTNLLTDDTASVENQTDDSAADTDADKAPDPQKTDRSVEIVVDNSAELKLQQLLVTLNDQGAGSDNTGKPDASGSKPNLMLALCETSAQLLDVSNEQQALAEIVVTSYCNSRSEAITAGDIDSFSDNAAESEGKWERCTKLHEDHGKTFEVAIRQSPDATQNVVAPFVAGIPLNQQKSAINAFEECAAIALSIGASRDALTHLAILTALGSEAYGELIAGQLALGIGTDRNLETAATWYDWTARYLQSGGNALSVRNASVQGYDYSAVMQTMATSVPELEIDGRAYLDMKSENENFDLVSFFTAEPAFDTLVVDKYVAHKSAVILLDNVLRMSMDEALEICHSDRMAVVGLKACETIGLAAGDDKLVKQMATLLQ